MNNRKLQAGWDYHNQTKHSLQSVRASTHFLDWENQPLPFKIYSDLQALPLPHQLSSPGVPALTAVSAPSGKDGRLLDHQTLAEILHFSAGITKRRSYPGGEILFRAAACTGALYHIDLYLICGALPDLDAGVYHFGPHDFALRKLRAGDYRELVVRASGNEPAVAPAPVILACASTYWRNAWKYQARAYRHCYWDNGTILANLLAAAGTRGVASKVVLGFVDTAVARLLGLDPLREGVLSLVPLGASATPGSAPTIETLTLQTVPLSKREIDYPAIRAMHDASSLESEAEVMEWRAQSIADTGSSAAQANLPARRIFPLRHIDDSEIPRDSLEQVIQRRGSTRNFSREAISFSELSTMLYRSTRGVPLDCLQPGVSLNDVYLIVNAVEDLPSGAYFFHRDRLVLELLKEGDFRREAGYLGLSQAIPADASVDVFFMAELKRVLEAMGNRGYRAAQLDASITAGRLYLSAYALGLGASGLTFFDDDVTEFFSPHAAGKSVTFLIALGKSVRTAGKF